MKTIVIPKDIELEDEKYTFKDFLNDLTRANVDFTNDVDRLLRTFALKDKIDNAKKDLVLDDEDYDRLVASLPIIGKEQPNTQYLYVRRPFVEALTGAKEFEEAPVAEPPLQRPPVDPKKQ